MKEIGPKYLKDIGCIIFAALILTLCLIPGFLRLPYGVHFFDEPYQMLNGMFPEHAPYSPLTAYLTKWFGEFFNWRWLYFRYLALGLNVVSIVIAGAYLYLKIHRYNYSLIVTSIALLSGTITPVVQNVYSWDDWTQLLLVITLLVVIGAIQNPSLTKVIVLGILSAILTFIRIPNAIVIPIIAFIIWKFVSYPPENKVHKKTVFLGVYFISSLLVSSLILVLLYGSMTKYIESFQNNPISHHGFKDLIYSLFHSLLALSAYLLMFLGFYHILKNYFSKIGASKQVLLTILIAAFFFAFTNVVENEFFVWSIPAMMAVLFAAIIKTLVDNRYSGSNQYVNKKLYSIVLIGLVSFVGSNAGLIKYLIYPLFPIAALFLYPYLNRSYKIISIGMIIGTSVLVGFRLQTTSFLDKGFGFTGYSFTEGKLEGLHTTPERGRIVATVYQSISKYDKEKNKILCFPSANNYIWEYLIESWNSYIGCQFGYNDIHFNHDYINWAENEIETADKPVVVLYQKHERFEPSDIPQLPMLNMIEKHLKLVEDIDGFLIYASPNAAKNN